MKKLAILSCTVLAAMMLSTAVPAAEKWWSYVASYSDAPGTIRLDLDLYKRSPLFDYPYLLITGTTYSTTDSQGMPEAGDVARLDELRDKVVAAVQADTPAVYAGSFTHYFQQRHYFYVKNKTGLKALLASLYAKECHACKTYFSVRSDPSWSAYRTFLYPNVTARVFYKKELEKLDIPVE